MISVHQVAQLGFGTGTNELYDRARPSYQSQVLKQLRQAVDFPAPLNVLEIGSGTGIFTRALLKHEDWCKDIKSLKAVEPSAGMRDVFTKNIDDERVTVAQGTFDNTGVENGWADLITIAQAFHWCPDYNRACTEFARVLKPGGLVAFIWNLEDRDHARWVAQLRERIEQHENNTPQFRLGLWRQTFDTTNYNAFFKPQQEHVWSYHLPTTVDTAIDRALSKSYIAMLPEVEKNKVQEDIKEILARGDDRTWIDKNAGVFEYPYKTWLVIAEKR
ncbi:hypothetical protein AX16_003635 [Volvariella volvacea WC 439]|nr:hypothetical protein AX16_003635 [Volvariella volvacea WC 439]